MSTTPRHILREQRLARQLAARQTAPAYVTVETTAGEIRPGDFLVKVPTQARVRGAVVDALVETVEADYTWTIGGRARLHVDAVRVTFARAAVDPWTPALSCPSAFRVTVRRPAA